MKRGGDVAKARFYVLDPKILDDAAASRPNEYYIMICNSVIVAPESFSGGTGGTGGILRDSARQGTGAWDRGDRRSPADAGETKKPANRSPRYHPPVPPKLTKQPAVPPSDLITRKPDGSLARMKTSLWRN